MSTQPTSTLIDFLRSLPGFSTLSSATLEQIGVQLQPLRYPIGRAILTLQTLPTQLSIIYQGQVRLLGYDPRTGAPITLQRLEQGDGIGWLGLLRNRPSETAIASTETICLTLDAASFLKLIEQEPTFAQYYQQQPSILEVFEILGQQLLARADGSTDLRLLSQETLRNAIVQTLPPKAKSSSLSTDLNWFISGSTITTENGQPISSENGQPISRSSDPARLIGLPIPLVTPLPESNQSGALTVLDYNWAEIPEAPEQPPTAELTYIDKPVKYPFLSGKGKIDGPLACFGMLAQYFNLPFRRDIIRRILITQSERSDSLSLSIYGAIAETMGVRAQLVEVSPAIFSQLPTPALMHWQGQLIVLYRISPKEVVLGIPDHGIVRKQTTLLLKDQNETIPVLLLERTAETPQKRFTLAWFWPSVLRHRKVLIEVLIASFVIQLFALANPLVTQLIIDKVLVQNSIGTLNVLGILLVGVAIFEALLSSFRTYLFVDTTNRIDMALGAEVIDHLLRLPLRYFEKRPVGELSSRVNELENIRQFLTGTALTVVLDAVFSVVYIVVMVFYSWLLTLVALATVPLFALMTLMVSPIIRQQTRLKAERNAETQSYLVEVVSGIQTVKAQNIELKSRWQWQERYARYVSAGFKAVVTSTTAGAMSNFLNKLSSLLLLWVGAYLVLQGALTLGELIAFRIIAGYTTSPLLRLIQLWQNFQETALSLERLADILDHPQEVKPEERSNIPMPPILGALRYEDVSFSFKDSGSMQLQHIYLNIAPGTFVGVVGQSGSGKSTLMKLLMRLYAPNSGQILLDDYDVSKVELYSLRQQIGMVLQDSLLFDGTVQENIALTRPDATAEEIVEAAKVAYAHDFIMQLSQGYNTRVGERGSTLSGGQRQRIAIARTVLQNPRLLILDEATSALDYLAERQVCENLAGVFKNRTVFFITHRLKSLQTADVIFMMDQGKVVEEGTHLELMAKQSLYYCLYQQQEMHA
jgi:ATP-binding cassette, subfamily B, bacterial HlyB/CyaB